jgi:hypothetical protein
VRAGCQDRYAARFEHGSQINIFPDAQQEMCSHSGAQHLRRPDEGGSGAAEDVGNAGRSGAAQDRTEIARILQVVEQDRGPGQLGRHVVLRCVDDQQQIDPMLDLADRAVQRRRHGYAGRLQRLAAIQHCGDFRMVKNIIADDARDRHAAMLKIGFA